MGIQGYAGYSQLSTNLVNLGTSITLQGSCSSEDAPETLAARTSAFYLGERLLRPAIDMASHFGQKTFHALQMPANYFTSLYKYINSATAFPVAQAAPANQLEKIREAINEEISSLKREQQTLNAKIKYARNSESEKIKTGERISKDLESTRQKYSDVSHQFDVWKDSVVEPESGDSLTNLHNIEIQQTNDIDEMGEVVNELNSQYDSVDADTKAATRIKIAGIQQNIQSTRIDLVKTLNMIATLYQNIPSIEQKLISYRDAAQKAKDSITRLTKYLEETEREQNDFANEATALEAEERTVRGKIVHLQNAFPKDEL